MTLLYDTCAWGRFQGEEIFNRLHQHYGIAFPLTTDWLSAPNDANFIPRATTYIIELDSGTRSFTFQQGQEVKRIPGDDHLGLRAGHLPTPVVDAEHADLLTYEFQGAGGTTFIDLADDARHITIKVKRAVTSKNDTANVGYWISHPVYPPRHLKRA